MAIWLVAGFGVYPVTGQYSILLIQKINPTAQVASLSETHGNTSFVYNQNHHPTTAA